MWLRIVVTIILLAMILPILIIIPLSFSSSNYFEIPPPGFSMKWYVNIWENKAWITGFYHSFIVGISSAFLSVTLGTMGALAIRNINFKGKNLFMVIMVAPMIIPTIITGVALYYSLSSIGFTNTLPGLILSHSLITTPIAFMLILGRLRGISKDLELAAISLGSTPIGAFFKVTLPLMKHALIAGGIFAFITSFDEVIMTIFIAGADTRTLPLLMWEQLRINLTPTLAAVATLIIFITVTVFALGEWANARSSNKKDVSS